MYAYLKNQDVKIKAGGMPIIPARAASDNITANTIKTPAAPPRVGRSRWRMSFASGVATWAIAWTTSNNVGNTQTSQCVGRSLRMRLSNTSVLNKYDLRV